MRKPPASRPARTRPTGALAAAVVRNPDVADILFDLKRRETRTYAHIFSRGLVDNLRGARSSTTTQNAPQVSSSSRRRSSPPSSWSSAISRTPRMSSPSASPEWRAKAAAAMVKAIDAFFAGDGKPDSAHAESGVASSAVQAAAPWRIRGLRAATRTGLMASGCRARVRRS